MGLRAYATVIETEVLPVASLPGLNLSELPDPDPTWVIQNPDQAMAFFYLSPRPCEALEALLKV
jgi:hypothetical protein